MCIHWREKQPAEAKLAAAARVMSLCSPLRVPFANALFRGCRFCAPSSEVVFCFSFVLAASFTPLLFAH
jgi:hypothetical protein